jgi:protein arginine kinase activator
MKCNFCNQKATVFLTQLADGQMKKVCLCENCAKEKGVTDPTGFSLADMLISGVSTSALVPSSTYSPGRSGGKKCPNCGFSQSDFKKSGRLGCSECYGVFHEGLEGLLKAMHKGVTHSGKRPGQAPQTARRADYSGQIELLRKRLSASVEAENYEEAAQLRDELRQLEARILDTEA